MQIIKTSIEGLIELQPRIFEDERGCFFETFNQATFESLGLPAHFLQDNQSFSYKGVLRGLHFQKSPFAQGKLVRVVSGRVLDVGVDIRPGSATFGQYEIFDLDAKRGNMAYIPEGFAHGFVTLEDTIFTYKCTNVYSKESESGIHWNDPTLQIDWQVQSPIVSMKDQELYTFQSIFG